MLGVSLSLNAQNTTNKGTEFWVTFTSHINVEDREFYPPGLALYITSDVSASGTVSIPGQGYSDDFTVTPGNITVVRIPLGLSYVGSSEVHEQKGILVSSSDPVVVYSHIYGEKRSGATLVMPSRSLGREYRAVSYYNRSQFTVIGTEDNTWVEITTAAPTEGGRPANAPFKIELQRGEVYQVRAQGDLTGSRITTVIPENATCKKIAVYSGSLGVTVGCGGQGYDNLYQQLFAYSSWGKNYIAVPMENRPYDIVRILAGENNTNVLINGASHAISPGRFMEISQVTQPLVISSDEPVCVVQFTPSQSCDPRNPVDDQSPFYIPLYPGDPDMVILSPIEQNLRQITLYSSNREDITDNYINVIIGKEDISSFSLDGRSQSEAFSSIPGNPDYSYARFRVNAGTHRLTAGGGFNAIAYGFGNYESYAYLAGTNLLDFSKRITHATGAEIFSGTESCSGRTVRFRADLDFEVYSFQWDFGDGAISPVETDPSGLRAYEHTYALSGSYAVKLIILKSDGSECADAERLEIPYNIQIEANPRPEPDFAMPGSCANDLIRFENLSAIADGTELSYRWNFGDGSPEQVGETPSHRFPSPGAYQVTLYARSRYGCTREFTKEVIVNASDPLAGFSFTDNICQSETARFFDQSTVSFGTLIAWEWDFGGEGSSTEKNPEFQFPTPGQKTITLRAYSGGTCFAVSVQEITVLPVPQPVFALPEEQASVCASDAPFAVTGFSPLPGYQGGKGSLTAATGLDDNGVFHPGIAGPGMHEILYTFTNQEGCSETVSQFIRVQALPEVNAGKDLKILAGQSTLLNAQSNGVKFEWTPDESLDNPFILTPRASPETSTSYTLTVQNEFGCVTADVVHVEVLDLIKIPGSFTPNNDGVNDLWEIGNIEDYPLSTIFIFNRFGERVFYSNGYAVPWDGNHGNHALPSATYYYVIRPNEVHPVITGSITIIR